MHRGHRGAARPIRRRHRPDHPGRVPQAHRAHRVRAVPVRRVAQGSRTSCSTTRATRARRSCIAGANFGSGSSREHAPWAIEDYGFRAVIAPSFADIFRNNCTKIGLLPVELRAESVRALMDAVLDDPDHAHRGGPADRAVRAPGLDETFDIDDFTRWRLIEGLDDIGLCAAQRGEDHARTRRRVRAGFRPPSGPALSPTRSRRGRLADHLGSPEPQDVGRSRPAVPPIDVEMVV